MSEHTIKITAQEIIALLDRRRKMHGEKADRLTKIAESASHWQQIYEHRARADELANILMDVEMMS